MATNKLTTLLSNALMGDDYIVQMVWNKGTPVPGLEHQSDLWRYDADGRMIYRHDYGKRDSAHGWEKDHIIASALGGSDAISNLRPLHYKGNAMRGGLLGNLLRE